MSEEIKIGILGCGTVGSGLLEILASYPHKKQKITAKKVLVRDLNKERKFSNPNISKSIFTTDAEEIINDPEIQVVVELMGSVNGTKDLMIKAIENGKHIVTANKDLLAIKGEEIFEAAKKHDKTVQFEAAVAGGIPIINTLKQSLKGNKINKIYGIINGTTNYMLDAMEKEGADYDDILRTAQELGYAEADPTSDVEGHDAAYKIAILASIISGRRIDVEKVYREGISNISAADIKAASKRGYTLKLLGIADNTESKLDLRVHPVMISHDNPLASVGGVYNAVLVEGDAVGNLTLIGQGAGSLPTASAVMGDVLMLASQISSSEKPNPQHVCEHSDYAEIKSLDDVKNGFYVRISMYDRLGVLRDITAIMAENQVNVRFIDQFEAKDGLALADFIVDPVEEKIMNNVLNSMKKLESIREIESVIRVL